MLKKHGLTHYIFTIGLWFNLIAACCMLTSTAFADSFLQTDLNYLATPARQGRGVGLEGNTQAVNYIQTQMQKMGLKTLASYPQYLQQFPLFTHLEKTGENNLRTPLDLIPPEFEPIAFSDSQTVQAELVFAGFGISIPAKDPKLKYDDYKNIEVRDKIVVVMSGDPAIGNSNSLFRQPEYAGYSALPYKLNNAIQHGAKGFILIHNPLSLSNPKQESPLFFNATEGGGTRFSIVAGSAKIAWFDAVLAQKNRIQNQKLNLLNLQKKIALEQKPNSFLISEIQATLAVHLTKHTGQVANVLGYLPANGEADAGQDWVVLGAHLDHLGFGGLASMDPEQVGQIHPGADDNASGCALLLEVARNLSQQKQRSKNILFVFFNAEEMGLLGSQYFVETWQNQKPQANKINYMLNFDMVGRYQKDLQILGLNSAFEWSAWLGQFEQQKIPSPDNLKLSTQQNSLGSSDHASFIRAQIPSLFLTTGAHEDYHRITDISEKINTSRLQQIADWTLSFIGFLESKNSPIFNPASQTEEGSDRGKRGYGAQLGCIPEFSESPSTDEQKGVLCIGIVASSPAEKAGLKKGDILQQLGDVSITTLYDLAYALKYYRPQDTLKIKFVREHKILEANVTLASREERK